MIMFFNITYLGVPLASTEKVSPPVASSRGALSLPSRARLQATLQRDQALPTAHTKEGDYTHFSN